MISQSEKSCSQTMKSLSWCFLVVVAVTVTSAALLNDARVERDASSTTPGFPFKSHQDMPVNARVERDASSTTPGFPFKSHQHVMLSGSMPVNARVERDASSTTPGFPFKTDQRVAMKREKRSTIFPIDGIVERVAIFPVHEKTKRVVRESSEEDDSCKKMKPEHGAKMCCELPSVFRGSPEIFKACREELGLPDHKPPPPAPSAEGNGKPPHHEGPPHHRGKGCIAECLFNKTGLLENGKLNKEALQKSLDEYLKTDDAWKAVATSTLDKCYDGVQTKDFKPDNEKFTSGSSEFMRCFSRGLFMDCIPSKWTDSDECSKTKETLEKCPKMLPPGVFNKGHH